ncbi:MAG: ATP-binding cassette domain-containing protein [Proteobacteria bacterium]|nr:ATP-binding cassette domain-containing protein [Pseudomonadota bacterium]
MTGFGKRSLIKLNNVSKAFLDKEPLFLNLDASVTKGEFLFLTGISGAGKSTLFKLLIGTELPDEGQVFVNGKLVNEMNPKEMSLHRRKIGVIFQDYKLLQQKTAAENIGIPLQIQGISTHMIEDKIQNLAEKMKISHLLSQPIQSLSGGEQQLVAIARASIHSPSMILADEPTANLDQKMATQILDMLLALNEEGITIIIATHDINLIKSHDTRILLIKNSTLTEVG